MHDYNLQEYNVRVYEICVGRGTIFYYVYTVSVSQSVSAEYMMFCVVIIRDCTSVREKKIKLNHPLSVDTLNNIFCAPKLK